MQIRVLSQVISLGMTIALLLLLIMVFPCQVGGGEVHGLVNGAAVGPGPIVSATVTAEPPSPTMIDTGARFVETAQVSTSAQIATDVRRAETTPAPLLTGLARNKPSIWGSRGFYVLLVLVYVTLLGLFIKQVISVSEGGHEQG